MNEDWFVLWKSFVSLWLLYLDSKFIELFLYELSWLGAMGLTSP